MRQVRVEVTYEEGYDAEWPITDTLTYFPRHEGTDAELEAWGRNAWCEEYAEMHARHADAPKSRITRVIVSR